MKRERVAENIYVFTSDVYVQVACGVLIGREGAILVDTLPVPRETREVRDFIWAELGPGSVRYVINTHFHSDHVYGSFLFPEARVVSQDGCREQLRTLGRSSLQAAKRHTRELGEVEIRLPDITFGEEMCIHFDSWTLRLFHAPGHTADSLIVFIPGEKVLFAGDTVMPIPHIVWGEGEQMKDSLQAILALKPDIVVQGHGQVLLRGEMRETISSNMAYLDTIHRRMGKLVAGGGVLEDLADFDVEAAGKSRLPLDGLVTRLHRDNLSALYSRLKSKKPL